MENIKNQTILTTKNQCNKSANTTKLITLNKHIDKVLCQILLKRTTSREVMLKKSTESHNLKF